MSDAERRTIEKYVLEVFHYEHQCSTEILARIMLLCELLIEKGIFTDKDIMEKLSIVNIAEIMNELNYGDDTWKEEEVNNESN
ncbi:MAG: hypothetical protein ACI4OP_01805 [Candidatus Coprovivens sp.]